MWSKTEVLCVLRTIELNIFIYKKNMMCLSSGKNSVIKSVYKKGGRTDCSNDSDITLFWYVYKILFNINSLYVDKITGNH